MSKSRINQLFERYYDRKASPEETDELMAWIADPVNEHELVELMQERWEGMEPGETLFTADKSRAILKSLLPEAPEQDKPLIRLWRYAAAAAVVGALLCTGFYLLTHKGSKDSAVPVAQKVLPKDVLPGGRKAILTLANGSAVTLDSAANGLLAQQGATTINKEQGQLTYKPADAGKSFIGYNTVATPRGGEYQVVLPDGSRVWLNAASSLHFPTAFTGATREVQLTGEAYFEIAQNKDKPFHVLAGNVNVEVLGTHFNVMSYEDEPIIKTSLLEGRVRVSKGTTTVYVSPSQGASLDKGQGLLTVKNTEVEKDVAWKEGDFDFENDDIQTIMRQLARWYDIKIVFDGNFDDQRYTGQIRRQVPLSQVLNMLQLAGGIECSIDGNTITVKRL